MRLPMIESLYPQDWLKHIRSEINRYKDLFNKKIKKNSSYTAASLDLDKSMEKRRIQAIMNALEKLPEERKPYVSDFILLNIFQPNYSILDEDHHFMTAAAIWILDRISEAGNLGPELFKLLPHDESLLDDLFTVTLTDSQYDESLIASVEYVLRHRNEDIVHLRRRPECGQLRHATTESSFVSCALPARGGDGCRAGQGEEAESCRESVSRIH